MTSPSSSPPPRPERPGGRFAGLDDPERPPRRGRPWAVAGAVAVVAVVAVVAAVLTRGSGSHPVATPTPPAPTLPAGLHPLPGLVKEQITTFGIVGRARSADAVSRAAALRGYDRIRGAADRHHRMVLMSLVRADYIDGGQVRHGTFWVVSVWFHFLRAGPQWCVDDGLVDATTGRPSGHVLACPLPAGTQPYRAR